MNATDPIDGFLSVDLPSHLKRDLQGLETDLAIDEGPTNPAHARDEALDFPIQRLDRLHLDPLPYDFRALAAWHWPRLCNIDGLIDEIQ